MIIKNCETKNKLKEIIDNQKQKFKEEDYYSTDNMSKDQFNREND